MEDTFIVIMLKNKDTGFLETELGSYRVEKYEKLIYNVFAVEKEGKIEVHMRLSVDRELLDWEFEAVFDYYDTEVFNGIAKAVIEDDEGYDPVWEIVFDFIENDDEMENRIEEILALHKKELDDVYTAIQELEEEYK